MSMTQPLVQPELRSSSPKTALTTRGSTYRFLRRDLKYFPLQFLRNRVESHWGFFLTMTARMRAA